VKVKFLGHSAVLIEDGDFKCIIDPYLSQNHSYIEDPKDIDGITHILITHGHGDHIGDCESIALQNNSLIISNAEIVNYLRTKNNSLRVHPLQIGGSYQFDFGTVKMTPALHGSAIHNNGALIYGGLAGGFLIERNGQKIYHAGDTGLSIEMKLLEYDNIDLAFLPIGGNYTMDINDAVRAVHFIKPKQIIPMHYHSRGIIQADPEEFKRKLPEYKVTILNNSESIEL
jgi:L-ascorbate metabolism protein UlaG (beta-lactamase superfamily)